MPKKHLAPPFIQIATCVDSTDGGSLYLYALDADGCVWHFCHPDEAWFCMPRTIAEPS